MSDELMGARVSSPDSRLAGWAFDGKSSGRNVRSPAARVRARARKDVVSPRLTEGDFKGAAACAGKEGKGASGPLQAAPGRYPTSALLRPGERRATFGGPGAVVRPCPP